MVSLRFQNHINSSLEFSVEAHILPRLTGKIPAAPVIMQNWTHIEGLDLADPEFNVPGPIDILLGANIYAHLLEEEIRKSTLDAPVAQLTALGWIVSGPAISAPYDVQARSFACSIDQDLHELVRTFRAQEEVTDSGGGKMSEEEAACEQHFISTHARNPAGRYMVRLPFKKQPPFFGDSRTVAIRMLKKNMHRRFEKDPTFHQLDAEFMEEYARLNHMEPAATEDTNSFYLQHHGVLRGSSVTTKLRVVFNGSQKTDKGISLNDYLLSGPKMQTDLIDVLLPWCIYRYVFTADVEKMYRQIILHPDDRSYQRIMWSGGAKCVPNAYQLCTVTHGLTCAPYLAIRILRQLADDEEGRFPLATDVVRNHFYVDDVLSGSDTIQSAREKAQQFDTMLLAGGFCPQKWASNEDQVISAIGEDRRATLSKLFEDGPILRALGLSWNLVSDSFVITLQREAVDVGRPTKRSVLSIIARLFYPLGWLAPVIIIAKIYLQSLWKTELQWDDTLPDVLFRDWQRFIQELGAATSFCIPCWVAISSSVSVEIHGFSDASKEALAAAVYIRATVGSQKSIVSLLLAKTKVAPLKPVTIARLELSAAVLLEELVVKCQKILALTDGAVHLWTDSAVALAWIRGRAFQWKEYVGNRVTLIQDLLPRATWHHVPGVENPADVASRGMYPRQLLDFKLWWN